MPPTNRRRSQAAANPATLAKPAKRAAATRARSSEFRRRLGALTFRQACRMLGDEGERRLREGEALLDGLDADAYLGPEVYRLRVPVEPGAVELATVTLTRATGKDAKRLGGLKVRCDKCNAESEAASCDHAGAALSHLLESKSALGLAAPPDPAVPLENLTAEELVERALAERAERAQKEQMTVRAVDTGRAADTPWTDYLVTSGASGRTHRVALRGTDRHDSFCTCPDFRTNLLGTCKHVLHVIDKVGRRLGKKALAEPHRREHVSLSLFHGSIGDPTVGLRFHLPDTPEAEVRAAVGPFAERPLTDAADAVARLRRLEAAGHGVLVYPDAEGFIERNLVRARVKKDCDAIREDPANHPLRKELLDAELLPYQLDGIAFAAGTGRAVLADDMGLGKTIQGIGVAELLARLAGITRVLVICPASLKSQWRTEVQRFSGRSVQLVMGSADERRGQYESECFFTVCNYEQVLRDASKIEHVEWDLIVLDEGQRIKNWESKTSATVSSLDSPFRLVLTGTPLENRLGDLFTVVRFVDEHRLGPAHRFFHTHHVVDDEGKTLGYHRLDALREALAPVLLRRTRAEVARQLPKRTDEVVEVEPTSEQAEIHEAAMQIVRQIVHKKWLTEMDLLRLQKQLLIARMSADSSGLCDRATDDPDSGIPEFSSKLERLDELFADLLDDPTRKIVVFSEWTRMLDRIGRRLDAAGARFVRLDGKVPVKKRPAVVKAFQEDPDCRVILMSNAGSTGLNLQSANVVINVDLPWNPAVLEQRIARAHRMGQQNPVHVYKLVTAGTIEERLLGTLAAKQELADASIDFGSDITDVATVGATEDLRRRLEKMLDPAPAAPEKRTQAAAAEEEARAIERRRAEVGAAGGKLVGAALELTAKLLTPADAPEPDQARVAALTEKLSRSVERDEQGRPRLTLALEDDEQLRGLAVTLARLLG